MQIQTSSGPKNFLARQAYEPELPHSTNHMCEHALFETPHVENDGMGKLEVSKLSWEHEKFICYGPKFCMPDTQNLVRLRIYKTSTRTRVEKPGKLQRASDNHDLLVLGHDRANLAGLGLQAGGGTHLVVINAMVRLLKNVHQSGGDLLAKCNWINRFLGRGPTRG